MVKVKTCKSYTVKKNKRRARLWTRLLPRECRKTEIKQKHQAPSLPSYKSEHLAPRKDPNLCDASSLPFSKASVSSIFDFFYYPRIFSRVNLNLLSWKERLISVLSLSKFWSGYHQFNSFESISKDIGQTQFKVQILFQMPSQNSLKFEFKLNFIDQIKIQILLL